MRFMKICNRYWPLLFISVYLTGFTGCSSTQGPTWKEQVTKSLEHYYKGESLHKKNNLEEAEKEYLLSLEISPRPLTYYRLAQIQGVTNRNEEAISSLDQALKLNPGYQRALLLKKQLLLRMESSSGKTSEQSSLPQRPVMLQTPDQQNTTEKVQPITKSTPKGEDITQIDKQLKLPVSPEDEQQDLINQANIAFQQGQFSQAYSLYKKIIKKSPITANIEYNFGCTCYQLNRLDEAETALKKAIELQPDHAEAYTVLGNTQVKLKRSGEALKSYEKAVGIGTHADAFFHLALLKEKTGKYRESVELYRKFLDFEKSGEQANFAMQRIEKLKRLAY